MAKIRVTCPTCVTPLELDAEYAGQDVQCGSCHEVFTAKADRKSRPGDDADDDRPLRRRSKSRREADDEDDDYDRPRRRRRSESGGGTGLATTAMVLGLLSIPMACCCGLFSLPLSAGGLICGVMAMRNPEGRGMALTGAITGGIGLLLMIASIVFGLAANFGNFGNRFGGPRRNPWQQQQQNNPWNQPPPPQPRNFR